MKNHLFRSAIRVACLVLGLWAGQARAQQVTIPVSVQAGSGLEIGGVGGGGTSTVRRSPFYVSVDAGLLLDNDLRFEVGAGVLLEVEGRVGVALVPQLRIHTKGSRVRAHLLVGVPLFIAPYTLFGISAGPGVTVKLGHGISLITELQVRAYPFGNDLPDGSALFHLDLSLGFRHDF